MKDKAILNWTFIIASYFSILFVNAYWLKIYNPILSFLQEILTIPLLLAQVVLLFIILHKIFIKGQGSWPIYIALFILLIVSLVTLGSLFNLQ